MQDANFVRRMCRMAIVKVAVPSANKTKECEDYKFANNTEIEVERPVQRLILLVPVDSNDQI